VKSIHLVILISLGVLCGCRKDEHKVQYFPVPDSLKKIALFQKNSYWVFQNDTTGETDCTYVNSDPVFDSSAHYAFASPYIVVYSIKMPLQSSLFSVFGLYGRLGNKMDAPSGYPFLATMVGYYLGCGPGNTAFILHNDTLTNHQGDNFIDCTENPKFLKGGGDKYIELGEHSNFLVNGILFANVRETRSLFIANHNSPDTIDYFFSAGHGLIKVVLRVDTSTSYNQKRAVQSWSLLRYKVIK
jgi:hypothetical protein